MGKTSPTKSSKAQNATSQKRKFVQLLLGKEISVQFGPLMSFNKVAIETYYRNSFNLIETSKICTCFNCFSRGCLRHMSPFASNLVVLHVYMYHLYQLCICTVRICIIMYVMYLLCNTCGNSDLDYFKETII